MKEDLPSQDHIVSFPMLTILTGQSHISKLFFSPEISKRTDGILFEIIPLKTKLF